jgi:L-aminoadipate-semialdehyde dehydrogenase
VSTIDYVPWRTALERFTIFESKDNALYPLLHFVLDNLPQSTKAPELDDRNARILLEFDSRSSATSISTRMGVTRDEMGVYLAYLVSINFLNPPSVKGSRELPKLYINPTILEKLQDVGGRGSKSI